MLAAVYLLVIVLPLALTAGAVVLWLLRRLAPTAAAPDLGADASVTELHPPAPPAEPSATAASAVQALPVGFRYDAVTPGPLQLVDDDVPSTKVCPDCAETVLASARVCKHCHFRFEPPLRGSYAV